MKKITAFLIISIILAVFLTQRDGIIRDSGFLLLGSLLSILSVFLMEEYRTNKIRQKIGIAIYQEIANRVGRCCFDFESPWATLLDSPASKPTFWLRKFSPVKPVIYPAIADQIAEFEEKIVQRIIHFYNTLEIWSMDLDNIASDSERNSRAVTSDEIQLLAGRLHRTLDAGLFALEDLSIHVKNHAQIDKAAMDCIDSIFKHQNHNKSLKERIKLLRRDIPI